ncbi:AIF_collapsed_G0031710.mRNA.1.CDS.1 [Saccharomyces cerevisiae]|nr:AIF_collapsed_G0031710.mRNA.1.CDS.1 [Saccharomyces cerevisiae]
MAEEIVPLFQVAWNDAANPDKGFQYLYLTSEGVETLKKFDKENSVLTERTVKTVKKDLSSRQLLVLKMG